MNKSLDVIQKISGVGRVLSKIVFIFCIVGFCMCAVSLLMLAITGNIAFKVGGVSIYGIIQDKAGYGVPAIYAALLVGMAFCASEAVVSRHAELYFRHEKEAGTPFTLEGAKEMQTLGILAIAVPLGTRILCGIGVGIATHYFPEIAKLEIADNVSVGLGVMFIITALFCRYGAELRNEKQ